MYKIIEIYLLTFIPIFVAVDSIGNVPLFLGLVEGTTKKQKHRIILDSVTTATAVAVIFMFAGKLVLRFIGITIADFQIAGGTLLFALALRLLLPFSGGKTLYGDASRDKMVGVFPMGTPLITGPAVLTTTLMMLDTYGVIPTFTALVINMFIVWLSLVKAEGIMKFLGEGGTRAFAKIMYILLAAIGVMMVRKGVSSVVTGFLS